MATAETFPEEECCNVYWKIRNFSYCCGAICSPVFKYNRNYPYYLTLLPTFSDIECKVSVSQYYSYDFETMQVSFLTCDGSPEESISGKRGVSVKVEKDVIFGNRRNSFLPLDTLTVRMRWLTNIGRGKFFISSQIAVDRQYFLWTFESLKTYSCFREKYIEISVRYGDIKLELKSMSGINSAEQFSLEIYKTGGEKCYCILKVSILDLDGNSINEVSDEFVFQKDAGKQVRGFPSIIKKSKWLECKNLLLKEDKLSLKCSFAISPGTVTGETADISYCEHAAPLLKQSDQLLVTFQEKNYSSDSVSELLVDLKNILQDGTLADTNLQIGAEVIQVHRSILSARSPVFKAMFTKDMKEKNTNLVIIEDLDVDTIRRLLLYLYTDTIHPDQWEITKKLYIAANKYEVLSLKEKCAFFLKTNLSVSNVSEALVLADMHEDEELKSIVLDFISKFDSAVFHSEEWKELGRKNSSLVIQVVTEICCRKRF